MPTSTGYFKSETKDYILRNYNRSIKILDIGPGVGTYYHMLDPEGYANIDCVEVFPNYVVDYKLTEKYKKVILGDVTKLDINFDEYDLIILGDVLEHIALEDAKTLLNKMKGSNVIVAIPFNSEQGIHFDNVHEIHLQADLTFTNFFERFEGFKPFCLRFDYGLFVRNADNNTIYVETQQCPIPNQYDEYIKTHFSDYKIIDVDKKAETINITTNNLDSIKAQLKGLSKEERENLIQYLSKPPIEVLNKNLTLTTGLWNLNRPGRDFSHYIEHFKNFLDIPCNMYIYIQKEYEHIVWEKRSPENTFVRIFELEDIKKLYEPFWDKTQEIRQNPDWLNMTGPGGWLPGSPQAVLEMYNPVVMSKMFLLHDSKVVNPFNTDYFLWLDAGITNTVYDKYLIDNRVLDKIIPHLETFLFLSYPYDATDEIHGFDFKAMNHYAKRKVEYVCRGGMFGGHKEYLTQANGMYYGLLLETLNSGYMGTEESIFSIMANLQPHIYRRFALDANGLIVKYVQALLDGTAELEDINYKNKIKLRKEINPDTKKVSIYMLTFNFPEQVESTIKTWLRHPKFITNTRNILIDNSTKEEARIRNKEVADQYGFEHIIMNENKGICGGRQFAAEHFQASDSDYYIFIEDDMELHPPDATTVCRNGFRQGVPNLYDRLIRIIGGYDFDFLKLSYTEVYMDNNIQVSWYNVPQNVRTEFWPDYDQLPINGLDVNAPRTQFNHIEVLDGLSCITGDIYYANWPMIVGKTGNQKMFLDTIWTFPYEQTWMSQMFQDTKNGKLEPAVLLASPVNHNRIAYYTPEERREN